MKTKFYTKVDKRSRMQMINFLLNHFRYSTMNSWNGSHSWANNLKVYKVIPDELQDKVFEMLECDDIYDEINGLIGEYDHENNYSYQSGFNGRSGGYLVMYEGGYEYKTLFDFENSDRDYEDGYGWLNLDEAKERGLYKKQIKKIKSFPGRSVDDYDQQDYEDMEMFELVRIVERVQMFDKLCDDIVSAVIYMAENNEVEEKSYQVTKTYKVMV